MFGTLYPRSFAEAQGEGDRWWMQTECLVLAGQVAELETCLRFLHLTEASAIERQIDLAPRSLGRLRAVPETIPFETATGGAAGVRGTIELRAVCVSDGLFKIITRVGNVTPFAMRWSEPRVERRAAAARCAFASTHLILSVRGAEFVSLVDPPEFLRAAAGGCENVGTWPVLVGRPEVRDMMLSAPIILADYPRVAPESPGDFFDATEIDELLTLRVLTLTDEEKEAMRTGDERARTILDRTEALVEEERRRLHGISRPRCASEGAGAVFRPGTRVRLNPQVGGDIFDLALAGRTATVVRVEEDYDGRVFVAVTVDDDPGQDLGADGRPGHRFFFRPEEVELLS
jgi:hypothetical protein